MKRLIRKILIELVIVEFILAISLKIIKETIKDSYNYKISLNNSFKQNKILYKRIFNAVMKENTKEMITKKDVNIWINQLHQEHKEYLEVLGARIKVRKNKLSL